MALWMTVEQELFGLAALLLVFSCVFLRGDARDRGKGKSEGLALFDVVALPDQRVEIETVQLDGVDAGVDQDFAAECGFDADGV